MKKLIPIVWIIIGALFLSFIGIKNHPEEEHRMVVVKHRPSLHIEFYSPLGGTTKLFEELSPKEQEQELLYREFIKRPQARTIDNIAVVFFQLGIYLIVLSLLRLIFFRRKYRVKLGGILSMNFLGIAIALGIYQIYWSKDIDLLVVLAVQIVLNVLMIFPRLRKNAK